MKLGRVRPLRARGRHSQLARIDIAEISHSISVTQNPVIEKRHTTLLASDAGTHAGRSRLGMLPALHDKTARVCANASRPAYAG